MNKDVYSTTKLAHHPEVLENLRTGAPQAPVLVQWFPTNVCNQACGFCSFGSGPESVRAKVDNPAKALWKNQQLFGSRDVMPRDKMLETIACFKRMGVKAVEITGGGEPTSYPHFMEMWQALVDTGIDLALVTNGTLLTGEDVQRLHTPALKWVRVSIDSGNEEEYRKTRNVPANHFQKAWNTVTAFANLFPRPQLTVGVGFVVDRTNWEHVYEGCRMARDAGADNIRVSASFTPDGVSRFPEGAIQQVKEQLLHAKWTLEPGGFQVHDLFSERINNVLVGRQQYSFCTWKEIGCVIGADQVVYACCSLAYNRLGVMGTIVDQTFEEMWFGEGKTWRDAHDARKGCRIHCLYERRNLDALQIVGDTAAAKLIAAKEPPPHVNFV